MNKSVLVTGAQSGTGYAIASRFAKEGYAVFITSRNKDRADLAAEQIARQFNVFSKGYQLEAGDEDKVISVFNEIKKTGYLLDVLILNAAHLGLGMNVFEVKLSDWMDVLVTNLSWNFSIARQAAVQMREKQGGSIVFIGSNTYRRAIKDRSAYIASKGGIVSLVKALAIDLGQFGIRVNVLLPGSIKTTRWEESSDENKKIRSARVPIGDIADFDDMANGAWYFGSDLSKNTTGAELIIDGGVDAQLFPL